MKVIDFHTHIYPDAIAPKAAASIRSFYSLGNEAMDGTAATLLRQGGLAGTHSYVILPVAMKPERTRHINDFIISQRAQHPQFYGFGTVHAGMEALTDEIQYIMDNKLLGVKMHPDSQVFPIDDPRLFPAYEMLQDKLPVILHMGDQRFEYSRPARLRHVLELFPKLQVIAAHFGGYSMHEDACTHLEDTDCFFDVSSSLMFMEPGVAENYINRYGAERFVYGSDYPMWDPAVEMERFLKLQLRSDQFEQIGHKTAEYLLKLR